MFGESELLDKPGNSGINLQKYDSDFFNFQSSYYYSTTEDPTVCLNWIVTTCDNPTSCARELLKR